MLPQVVVDLLRQGVPIASAAVGPIVARQRGMDVSTLGRVAGYTLGGWLAGYMTQSALFWAIEGMGRNRLPTEVAKLSGVQIPEPKVAPVPPPSAPTVNDGVMEEDSDNVIPLTKKFDDSAYGSPV